MSIVIAPTAASEFLSKTQSLAVVEVGKRLTGIVGNLALLIVPELIAPPSRLVKPLPLPVNVLVPILILPKPEDIEPVFKAPTPVILV